MARRVARLGASIDMTTETDTLIDITPGAMETVLGILAEEDDPGSLGLRIEITGTKGVDFIYDLSFDDLANAAPDDVITPVGEIKVIVPAGTVDSLRGSTLDIPRAAGQGGLVIRNPNRPDPMAGVKDLVLTGDIAEKVTTLIAEAINPGLAAHGGFTSLLGVEGTRVFLTMGGGCQGCSMSAATMVQGIQSAIKEAIPEVTEVIDATDHSAGENPFYD
jgi:Fe/S biogenesis protein NfuA